MGDALTVDDREPLHPLLLAGKWLLADLLSTLAFLALYAATHSILVATGLSIAIGLGQVLYSKARGIPIDAMQWLLLGLVVVFGLASLVTHNPRFVVLQPTLIYAAVGFVMLKPGWQNRYLPPIAKERGSDICFAFGFIWSALMFITAAANLFLVTYASLGTVALFLSLFPIGSKLTLVLIQYGVTRLMIGRRIRAESVQGSPA